MAGNVPRPGAAEEGGDLITSGGITFELMKGRSVSGLHTNLLQPL